MMQDYWIGGKILKGRWCGEELHILLARVGFFALVWDIGQSLGLGWIAWG